MGAVDKAARLRLRAVAVGAAGQPVRAARLLHRALTLLGSVSGAPEAVAVHARVLASLAYFEAERGEVDAGLRLLDEADRLAATIDDPNVGGNLHLQRGSILVRRGSMDSALAHLDSAVALLDGSDQCVTLLNRSALHLYRGDLAAADADLRQCVTTAALHGLGVLYAKARFNLGHLAYRRGDLPAALRDIDAALHDPLLTSALHAIALGGRAEALRAAGLTREADADLAEAVVIFRRERLTHDLGEALLARTQVALLERRWSDALRYSRQARSQFARRGNTVWADLAELDGLQAQLGLGRTLAGVAASAADLAGRLRATGLTEDARVASLVAARAHLSLGDPTAAATIAGAPPPLNGAVTTGTPVAATDGAPAATGAPVTAAAAVAAVASIPGDGAPAATPAASVGPVVAGSVRGAGGVPAVRLTDGDRIGTRLLARLVRAELAGARGDRVRREAELRGGLADVHRHQASFGSLDLQTASAMHGSRLAELGIADAVRDGRPSVVFSWSERARALTARLPAVRPPDDPRAAEMLADLRGVRTALRAAELAGQRVPELRRRRAQLERQVRQRAWFTAGPAEVERPVSLGVVRAALGDGCLVVYLAVGGVLHALVARSRSARLVRLSTPDPATATLQRVRADLDAAALTILPPPMREVVLRSLTGGLRRLDEALWQPIAALTGDGPVVIVPTAALGAVPWTLLPSLRGRPLAVTPSATSWLAARARPPMDGAPVFAVGPGVPRGGAEVHAAAQAWSTPSATPPSGVALSMAAPAALSDGPVLVVGRSGGGAAASAVPTVLTGEAASSGAVLAAAARARLLHVAAHGVHEADNPLFSSIQLADGPLFGYDLPRAAALPTHVVLSACDLGLAEVRPGDEALGMTSALLHGGVASVVAGVARVGDEVAGTAMVAYHRALAAGHAPAFALAAALATLDPTTPAPLVCFGAAW